MRKHTHTTTTDSGVDILGHMDHDLHMELVRLKRANGMYVNDRKYLVDHPLVNALFWQDDAVGNPTKQYVCRSIVQQWWYTGYVLTGTLIQKSGSSKVVTLESLNKSALVEMEHQKDFWGKHTCVRKVVEKTCVYCGAGVLDQLHYQCGMSRTYERDTHRNDLGLVRKHDKHDRVHDSIMLR